MIDLVFIVDDGGSIHLERFPMVLSFIASIVAQLDVGPNRTRVGLIYYSDNATLGFALNQYTNQQDVIEAVMLTPYVGGRTDNAAALRLLRRTVLQVRKPFLTDLD